MSVVVATIAGAPAIVYALLFVGGAVWVLATIWMRTPIAAVVLVAVLAAVSLTVRAVHRDSWTAGGWERVGKHLPPVSSVPADHPAVALLERLSALAGVEVPDLERVGAPGLNACVVVGHGTRGDPRHRRSPRRARRPAARGRCSPTSCSTSRTATRVRRAGWESARRRRG